MSKKSVFVTALDFCANCGTVLPLPGTEDVVTCKKCGFQIDVMEFNGVEIHSKIIFNKPETKVALAEETDDLSGPMVDRKCPTCGSEGMVFTTRQTRSADEGQTVFYTCKNCRFQEIEYS